jgi:aldehyde dehydrogenase
MVAYSAVELDTRQIDALTTVALPKGDDGEPHASRDFIGRNANVLARSIGLDLPDELRLLIGETDALHPFVTVEQMMPFLPIARVRDVDEGIVLAIESEHGYRHTAVIHSKNIEHMHNMARAVDTTVFVKNGPSYAGLGVDGEGYSTYSIAGPTGEGLTTARTFTRRRRCSLVDYFRIT